MLFSLFLNEVRATAMIIVARTETPAGAGFIIKGH